MKYMRIDGLDKDISRLIQGAIMLDEKHHEKDVELLDGVVAAGCTTIDTGHVYGPQRARSLGKWIQERNNREDIVIIDKGCHHNGDRKRVTPFDLASDLHDSLARLHTDYIDIYLLHRDDPSCPVGPIIDALNAHMEAGRIRIFGASNWSVERIQEANAYADKHHLAPFKVSSPNYSLAAQIASPWGDDCVSISGPSNEAVRTWYKEHDFPLFTWSSIARGFFSGRYTRANYEEMKGTDDDSSIKAYCYEENFERLDRAKKKAEEKGLTIPQVALAYVLNQPMNICAAVGCNTAAEFDQCAEAAAVVLTPEELAWLDTGKNG